MEDEDGKQWLRSGACQHNWRLGPLTDLLLRFRQAVCVKCWEYEPRLTQDIWQQFPVWTDADYEANKDEVERRFFGGDSAER